MPSLDGVDFDDEGKKPIFLIFMFLNCFWYMHAYNISLVYADVGPEGPTGMSPIARCIPHPIDVVDPY